MSYFFSGKIPLPKNAESNSWRTDNLVVTALDAKNEQEARAYMKSQLTLWLGEIDTAHLSAGTVNIEQKLSNPITL